MGRKQRQEWLLQRRNGFLHYVYTKGPGLGICIRVWVGVSKQGLLSGCHLTRLSAFIHDHALGCLYLLCDKLDVQ